MRKRIIWNKKNSLHKNLWFYFIEIEKEMVRDRIVDSLHTNLFIKPKSLALSLVTSIQN